MKELKDTVKQMTSGNYRERFVAEYTQTKIRYEKLKDYNNKIEAYGLVKSTLPLGETPRIQEPPHTCPLSLLRAQQKAMGEYLHALEIRAVVENIDLSSATDVMLTLVESTENLGDDSDEL